MLRVGDYANMLWKVALAGACAAMVVLWPNWRVALSTETYYIEGRMTGGGSCITAATDFPAGVRVTHGFEIHCNANILPNNLQINWRSDDQENHFHLDSLDPSNTFCIDDPAIEQTPPSAPFDTYFGLGTGSLNGVSGFTVDFIFTDAGEPGTDDTVEIVISGPSGVVLDVGECSLTFGNQQAHKENKSSPGSQTTQK
jgi:hypothetical protein